jgi:chemotaxis protein methyltransferase CheR
MALLARALANEGRLAEARFWSDRLVAARKLDPSALYLRAAIRSEQGATDAAMRDYRRALMLDPDFILAHVALGHLAHQRGHPAEAATHWEAAQALLQTLPPAQTLADSDGLSAGRLSDILASLQGKEAPHAR